MSEIVKADVFFFVSTLAVVAVTILLIVAIIYAIAILRDARKLSSMVREEGEEMVSDFSVIRKRIIGGLGKIINSFTKKNDSKKNKKSS